ncbi:MAG: methylmalonyl Co-A mutase-associated GTPase MeaB [Dongiaceae bacterium]
MTVPGPTLPGPTLPDRSPAGRSLPDRTLGRLISGLECGDPGAAAALDRLWRGAARAWVVGLSGPPGVGKSVLTGRLLHAAAGCRRAVLAVDPSSPISGGAVLADRMRLQAMGVPADVFVRSLASRGALGGLSAVVPKAIRLLEAAGYELVLLETVGVGQNETDVMGVADTVVVVQAPGAGDEIQGLKSGLLEIADIFVLNKCDLDGVEQARAVLRDVARQPRDGWQVPVVSTVATAGTGIDALWRAAGQHRDWLAGSGHLARRRERRLAAELIAAADIELKQRLADLGLIERFGDGKITVRDALAEIFGHQDGPVRTATKAEQRR